MANKCVCGQYLGSGQTLCIKCAAKKEEDKHPKKPKK